MYGTFGHKQHFSKESTKISILNYFYKIDEEYNLKLG